MFTDCPACRRQFHISAAQLTAAGGQVICGFCGRQFNALPRLRDRASVARLAEWATATADGAETPSEIRGAESVTASAAVASNSKVPEGIPAPKFDFAEILLSETPAPRPRISRIFWFLGACLLLLVIGGQFAWFHRDIALARYPGLIPRLKAVCERLDCSVYRNRDIAAIKLINRDVRDHPRFKNALLVNATVSNEAARVQPFPGIRLQLFDTSGQRIAYRDFLPHEYLDASIDVEAGMTPHRPVHVVLEIVGTAAADSFEFVFY